MGRPRGGVWPSQTAVSAKIWIEPVKDGYDLEFPAEFHRKIRLTGIGLSRQTGMGHVGQLNDQVEILGNCGTNGN